MAVCVDHISIKRHRICKSKWNVDDDHGDLSASGVSTDGERSFKSHRLLKPGPFMWLTCFDDRMILGVVCLMKSRYLTKDGCKYDSDSA